MKSLFVVLLALMISEAVIAQSRELVRTPLEYGMADQGQRIGIWKYYDAPGILGMEIDYAKMELRYFRNDTSQYVVDQGGQWKKEQMIRPCRLHGSQAVLVEHFNNQLIAPFELRRKSTIDKEIIKADLVFEVGPDGRAQRPEVFGNSPGLEKMMLQAFESAPNFWIPGVKSDGTLAKCRFGVSITICPDSCVRSETQIYRPLYRLQVGKSVPFVETLDATVEPTGLKVSPDNSWVLLEAKQMANTGGDGFMVLPLRGTGQRRVIAYGNIQNGYWKDAHTIQFKFRYGHQKTARGVYDLDKDSVWTTLDSITYFDKISPDKTKLVVAGNRGKGKLYVIDLATPSTTTIPTGAAVSPVPLAWTPDQEAIIYRYRKDDRDIIYRYKLTDGSSAQLPALDADVIGLTKQGDVMYTFRTTYPRASFTGEILSVNLDKLTLEEITGRVSGLAYAEYSASANKFLAIRFENLFLLDPQTMDWQLVNRKVSSASWSTDGTFLVFVSDKGTQLQRYDLRTGKSEVIHQQLPEKKK